LAASRFAAMIWSKRVREDRMFNPTEIVIDAFVREIETFYRRL
jgi:hypothetical protein